MCASPRPKAVRAFNEVLFVYRSQDCVALSPLPSPVPGTWLPKSLLPSCFPFEVRTNTGRLCSAASGRHPFPDVTAHIRPSDFLTIFGLDSGSPCLRPTLWTGARSFRDDTGACFHVSRGVDLRLPFTPGLLPTGNDQDLPELPGRPSRARPGQPPRQARPHLALISVSRVSAFCYVDGIGA